MITEDYVSFETARLLKEKGFPQEYDIYHSMVYNEEDYEDEYEVQRMVLETKLVKAGTLSSYPIGVPEPKCYCPTLQMAMKWLRIEHNIHIEPHIVRTKCSYGYMPNYIDLKELKQHFPFDEVDFSNADKYVCITYDKACEVALQYSLKNLI